MNGRGTSSDRREGQQSRESAATGTPRDPWSFPAPQPALPLGIERQLILDLAPPDRGPHAAPLETDANRHALRMLEAPMLWNRGSICLQGPKGSGKSLILRALFPEARWLTPQDFRDGALRDDLIRPRAELVFEDLDALLAAREADARAALETTLFHLLNMVAERGALLAMSARRAPATWSVAMPDLRTRLAATPLARIEPPSDDDLAAALRLGFRRCGVEVDQRSLDYLTAHLERSFDIVARVVERIDRVAREEKSRISPRLIAHAMRWDRA